MSFEQLQYVSPLRFNKFNKQICPVFLKCFQFYLNYIHSEFLIRYFIDEDVCDQIVSGFFDDNCSLIKPAMVDIRIGCIKRFKTIGSHKSTIKNHLYYSIDKDALRLCEKCNREQTMDKFLLSTFSKMSKFCKSCRYRKKPPVDMAVLKKCPMCV